MNYALISYNEIVTFLKKTNKVGKYKGILIPLNEKYFSKKFIAYIKRGDKTYIVYIPFNIIIYKIIVLWETTNRSLIQRMEEVIKDIYKNCGKPEVKEAKLKDLSLIKFRESIEEYLNFRDRYYFLKFAQYIHNRVLEKNASDIFIKTLFFDSLEDTNLSVLAFKEIDNSKEQIYITDNEFKVEDIISTNINDYINRIKGRVLYIKPFILKIEMDTVKKYKLSSENIYPNSKVIIKTKALIADKDSIYLPVTYEIFSVNPEGEFTIPEIIFQEGEILSEPIEEKYEYINKTIARVKNNEINKGKENTQSYSIISAIIDYQNIKKHMKIQSNFIGKFNNVYFPLNDGMGKKFVVYTQINEEKYVIYLTFPILFYFILTHYLTKHKLLTEFDSFVKKFLNKYGHPILLDVKNHFYRVYQFEKPLNSFFEFKEKETAAWFGLLLETKFFSKGQEDKLIKTLFPEVKTLCFRKTKNAKAGEIFGVIVPIAKEFEVVKLSHSEIDYILEKLKKNKVRFIIPFVFKLPKQCVEKQKTDLGDLIFKSSQIIELSTIISDRDYDGNINFYLPITYKALSFSPYENNFTISNEIFKCGFAYIPEDITLSQIHILKSLKEQEKKMPIRSETLNEEEKEKIEKRAMEIVMQIERKEGRIPKDVSKHESYDIISYDPLTKEVRIIEVKGHKGAQIYAELTEKEAEIAQKMGDKYYLYIVYNLEKDTPDWCRYKNPFKEMEYEVITIKRYILKPREK